MELICLVLFEFTGLLQNNFTCLKGKKKKKIYSKKQKWTIMEQLDASLMRRILMASPVEMKIKILC